MNVLLDYAGSLIVAGVVILIAVGLRVRSQEVQVDALVTAATKQQTFDTAEWLHDDLTNVGWGVAPSQTTMEAPTYDANGRTTRFVFWRRPSPDSTARRFVYDLVQRSTVSLDGTSTPLYQIVRCRRSAGGCPTTAPSSDTQWGGSSQRITDFRLDLLDEAGAPATPSSARLVRVRFSAAIPLVENRSRSYLRETHWAATLLLPVRS